MKIRTAAAVLGSSAVCACAAVKAVQFSRNQYQTIKNVSKLDDNIYLLDYCFDYDLEGMLGHGAANVAQMLAYASNTAFFGLKKFKSGTGGFACSAFDAFNENGEHLLGRNFDYKMAPCMVVWTHPKNAYAAVAVADCNFMLYGYANKPVRKANRMQALLAPYCCMDGINEKGLAIGILELKAKATNQQTGKTDISTTVAIRAVLDKCATVDEAVELLSSYDMHDAFFCCYHYQITDATGKSVIVEYVNNEMRLFRPEKKADAKYPYQYAANYFLSEDGDNSKGFGYERTEIIEKTLGENGGQLSDGKALDLLNAVHLNFKHEKYPWQVITLWSTVYNSTTLSARIAAGLDYNRVYTVKVNEPGKAVPDCRL